MGSDDESGCRQIVGQIGGPCGHKITLVTRQTDKWCEQPKRHAVRLVYLRRNAGMPVLLDTGATRSAGVSQKIDVILQVTRLVPEAAGCTRADC